VPLGRSLRSRLHKKVPSGPAVLPARRRERLVVLLACRNEARHLPGWLDNVAPHVDAIVALDDGSTDGSAELLEADDRVAEVLREPPDRPAWDEVGNFRRLVDAARRAGATWAVTLDADERVERDFRRRAERVIARGRLFGIDAYTVRIRDLWDGEGQFRCDGIWARKAPPRMFALRDDHEFADAELHAPKVPLQAIRDRTLAAADLEVYHLRMIRPEDRQARRERYERLDPEARWQPREGYAYLTDERELKLRPVSRRRDYRV
jgi:glycosyltransferase involved in cell wall biosynthesis